MIMEAHDGAMATHQAVLEHLRQNNTKIKSYDEIVSLLHVIASEQKTKTLIRSCMDKVLINMSDIHSLREMIERLRSVARTNGLRFHMPFDESAGSVTTCMITGDMFKVEISLSGQDSNFCHDVRVYHSDHPKSCPELLQIIREGKFLELSKYLKSLIDMYPINMDRHTKTRVYMTLQSLEMDISKMSQIYKESKTDCDNLHLVNHGIVGLLAPHAVGKNLQLNYFLSPYDLIDSATKQIVTSFDNMPITKGLHAEIKVVSQETLRTLPISPLISNNHPIDGTGKPRFAEVNQHNSISLPACFILKLCPAVVLTAKVAAEMQAETGIPVFESGASLQSYVSLVVKEGMCSEVTFDEHTHRYHLGFEHMQALPVEEIRFTHPGHVAAVLTLLRKQAYFNAIINSCVRPNRQNIDKETLDWYFDVSTDKHFTKLNITFEHPLCSNSTAFAEIMFSSDGYSACRLYTGRGDPSLCTDQYATKVLQKSYSLPITMRNLMKQTKRQPRKEPDRNRLPPLRSSKFFAPPPKPPAPVPHPPVPHTSTYTSPPKPTPVTTAASVSEPSKQEGCKEMNHPMLTSLLKPSHDPPKPSAATVQTKKHPMLLNLLNDHDTSSSKPTSNAATTTQNHMQSFQQAAPDLNQQFNPTLNNMSMPNYFTQQPTVNPMPPPPSYPTSMGMKPLQSMPHQQTRTSPLGLDDIPPAMTSSLTSPNFNAQTPPLMPVHNIPPSPNAPSMSMPSPMYSAQSPMQPPMNTPQSLAMTSPMHPAMTPPLPSPRKTAARRQSRTKSHSTEVAPSGGGFMDIKSEMGDFAGLDETDFFNTGTSPSAGGFMNTKLVSPNFSRGDVPPFGTNFSFDSDFGLEPDRATVSRRNSYGRRLSGQPFTPQPLVKQESQEYPTTSDMTQQQMDMQQQQFRPIFPNYPQNANQPQQQLNQAGGADVQDDVSIKTPTSVGRTLSQTSEQPEADPFKFDDNKKPSTISMTDTGVNLQRSGSLSRQSSTSSMIGEDSTLKGLLISPGPGSSGAKPVMGKMEKQGVLHNLLSKNTSNSAQRRGSEEAMSSQQSLGGHKLLVRQNAVSKPGMIKTAASLPAKPGEVKDKPRKRAAPKDEAKGPPKRRGRPPSTEKKEHSGKRKKMESGAEDSETRGKIVLNVQLNKGMPISSTTKTKPNQPEAPSTSDKNLPSSTAAAPTATPGGQSASTEIGKFPDLQRYLKAQAEMDKKKKEFKMVGGGSASPVSAGQAKGNGKFPTPPSAKSGSNGSKALATSSPKGQISPQQKAAAPKPRRSSINDVVKMLQAGHTSTAPTSSKSPQVGAAAPARSGPAMQGSVAQKSNEKSPGSASENPGLPKLKPIGLQAARIPTAKPPTKPTSILKQGSSKSPSHAAKPAGGAVGPAPGVGRAPQVVKKDPKQPRPVTPQRDEKGGSFASPPLSKSQMPANLLSQDPKLKSTLNRITETAAATAKHNLPAGNPNAEAAKQRSAGIGRLSSGGKSPGRSVTPPHAKAPFPSGMPEVHILNDSRILMKGRKSPAHALPPSDGKDGNEERSSTPRSNTSAGTPSRKSSTSDASLNPPPAKRPAISPAPTSVSRPPSATESPISPDDQLVIDDETAGAKINRSVTPVQAVAAARGSSPVVRAPQTSAEAAPPGGAAALMKKPPSDFELSLGETRSPCVIDDALMDEAVS